ncbi:hypothetical protein ACVOMV_25795 [Mesorhizobium atlanticum]
MVTPTSTRTSRPRKPRRRSATRSSKGKATFHSREPRSSSFAAILVFAVAYAKDAIVDLGMFLEKPKPGR